MNLRIWISIVLCAAGSLAYAGTGVSGGGGVVYCAATSSIELFDFYEGRTLRKLSFDLGPSTLTHMERVHYVLQRLSPLDANFAAYLWQRANEFEQIAAFIPDAKLNPISDVNGVFLPTGCDYVQAVAQKRPDVEGDPYFIVDKNLWDMMSEETKAGIILHEVIYHYQREFIHTDESTYARYYNSRISSPSILTFSSDDYAKLKETAGIHAGMLWQDTHALWWYSEPFDNTTSTPRASDCTAIGMRQPIRAEIEASYPELGVELKRQREVGYINYDGNETGIFVEWVPGNNLDRGFLTSTGVVADNNKHFPQFERSRPLCVGSTNPYPL